METANFNNVEKQYQVKTQALKNVLDRWELTSTSNYLRRGRFELNF